MGFKQTATHRYGKGSLPPDRPGPRPVRQRARWTSGSSSSQDAGFDGWEEASWELDLRKCDTDAGAAAYAKERRRPGQEARPGNLHRRHPPAGPGARRRAERQDAAVLSAARRSTAYKAWRDKGNNPPRTDPYFVPDEVGKLIHAAGDARTCSPASAWPDTSASCRTARWRCRASSARRPTAGATGSCSRRCRRASAATPSPTSAQVSLELLVERFGPVWDAVQEVRRDVRPGMPPERAGDGRHRVGRAITSTTCDKAGYEGVVGFNLDGSHMEWQNVSVVAVHPRVRRVHPLRPRQGRVGGARALPGRPARRPPADGPLGQRLELRHRRHRPRRQQRSRRSSSS